MSLFERDVEALFSTLDELDIRFVAYSPLGRGFLTGTAKPATEYDASDMRTTAHRWHPGNFEKNIDAVEKLKTLAAEKGATVAQLALAWLLAQSPRIAPIPGTRNPTRVEENVGAAELSLTSDDMTRIATILPTGGFGARYAGGMTPEWE
jgi:aryl-alcohol dehydrogenase-like predicted oxidoreductase